jgi:hypothetical protein
MKDDENPTAAEQAAAEALAQALAAAAPPTGARAVPSPLEGVDPGDLRAAAAIRAAARREAPLGEVRARSIARAAVAEAGRHSRVHARSMRAWMVAGVAAAALAIAWGAWRARPRPDELPRELCSRSAGLLVPGPFPPSQTAAERLDLVTANRLVAFREARFRTAGGARR